MVADRTAVRAPKQDRSRLTRDRILAAAIDTLADSGWNATTVALVAERAGVSRGAAQHHFPTREDLITAALEYMFDERFGQARIEAARIDNPSEPSTEAVVSRVIDYYTGPLFRAALQVWTAAAADPDLRARIVPLEERFGREAHHMAVRALGIDPADPVAHRLVQATLDLARGLGLANLLTDDSRRRGEIVRAWAAQLDQVLARPREVVPPPSGRSVEPLGPTGRTEEPGGLAR
ncbi:TetR/AcrR family transcriptional regulator [Millisia brevis]|uniref:TetR/AcrR family transcriptional regulator n=1 Tax=Millisia brevis TaxID=264148 RepID=UPI00082A639B|nr:TetR/AcrR family transcriptional regulator [Millisia brevis]